jgi:hypothetical protein
LALSLTAGSGAAVFAAKDKAGAKELARPVFSVPGGTFTNTVTLVLSAPSPKAEVRFTLDGSDPSLDSPAFVSALVLSNSTLVRARAFAPGKPPGPETAKTFLFLEPDVQDFTSNLPLLLVHSFGQEMSKEQKLPAAVRILDTQGGKVHLTDTAQFEELAQVNLRGRASLRYSKRSYNLKILDEEDEPVKVPMLGMAKDSDWVLYGPYPDKTLMRDVLAYELSNEIGRWAPRTRFIELFMNETGGRISQKDYLGVYVLAERVKRDKHRVHVAGLGPEDTSEPAISGGYIFKKDHSDHGDNGPIYPGATPAFVSMNTSRTGYPTGPGGFPGAASGFPAPYRGTSRSTSSSSSSSSSSSRTRTSRSANVTNYVGGPFRREQTTVTTRTTVFRGDDEEYVEIVEEDPFRGSFRTGRTNHFYYVDPEPDELTAVQRSWLKDYVERLETALYGPRFKDPVDGYAAYLDVDSFIDYHLLVELTKNVDGFRFSTFYHKDRGGKVKMGPLWDWNLSFGNCNGKQGYMADGWLWPQLDDKEYSWFRRLFEDPDFGQRYVDRWASLRAGPFATSNLLGRVDAMATLLQEAQVRNFQRWPILGLSVSPNWYVGDTFEEEIKWMKEWIANRLAWIEAQFVPAPTLSGSGSERVLQAAQGQVLYTLDGTDPRASGGQPSSRAVTASSPLSASAHGRLFARAKDGDRWSGPLQMQLGR